jgi:hypothetical protein
MFTRRVSLVLVAMVFTFATTRVCRSQNPTDQPATAQQPPDPQAQQEEKAKLEKRAAALLEQVVSEAQGLKLPENRVRVLIAAGDMLWDRDAARARGLFSDAGAVIGQMNLDLDRTDRDEVQKFSRLRQELVLTAARHDADLAYQLLHSTESATTAANTGNGRRFAPPQANLEQSLLSIIASTDPKVAYQKAVESLDKGEYPTAVSRVLSQLQSKDKEAFDKLTSKVLGKLAPDNLLSNREAGNMAFNLLRPGPRPADSSSSDNSSTATSANSAANTNQVLSESAYHDLLDATVTAAMSTNATAQVQVNVRGGGRSARLLQPNAPTQPDDAQVQQGNARNLLMNLQMMLPQVDQYLPDRAQAVRQKLSELGINNNQLAGFNQMRTAMQQGTSDALLNAAGVAPPQMQSRLYQQAAQKAIDEGNTDRAVQIANDHLDESGRASIMQAVDFKQMTIKASPEKLAEIHQKLAALPSDSDRIKFLLDLATATQKDNPKLALRFLEDARSLAAKKATRYKDFEDQLKVADAFSTVDLKRSFEALEPGINQLNELLNAASVLNGFEIDVFRDGELSLDGSNDLVAMVNRYGQEVASLSKLDFERARTTADKFQLIEPRLFAKLAIVQNVLGVQPASFNNGPRQQNLRVFTR